jgi:hypothetical protein
MNALVAVSAGLGPQGSVPAVWQRRYLTPWDHDTVTPIDFDSGFRV